MATKHCLILDNNSEHAASLAKLCESLGYSVSVCVSLETARAYLTEAAPDVAFLSMDVDDGECLDLLPDAKLADAEIMIMGDADDPLRTHKAMRLGASYFFCKPFDIDFVKPALVDIAAELDADDNARDPESDLPCVVDQFGHLRGSSKSMRKLYRVLRKVAPSNASLLIVGESGTGKELVARTVHDLSARSDEAFVAFNCAAVAETLIESELFGHEKGSFSGADKRHLGFFERAKGGTLLLDEITEMNMELQAKLLRVLEIRQIRRVGSEHDIDVDVRIISATNRIPEEAVQEDVLREDLYFRLAQIPVKLPPLRDRAGDICGLAQFFLNELNALHATKLTFAAATMDAICDYDWPGNVRQLRHAVERAYILSETTIHADALPDFNAMSPRQLSAGETHDIPTHSTLAEAEQQIILGKMQENAGDKKKTADDLGISLKTLYNRLKEYDE